MSLRLLKFTRCLLPAMTLGLGGLLAHFCFPRSKVAALLALSAEHASPAPAPEPAAPVDPNLLALRNASDASAVQVLIARLNLVEILKLLFSPQVSMLAEETKCTLVLALQRFPLQERVVSIRALLPLPKSLDPVVAQRVLELVIPRAVTEQTARTGMFLRHATVCRALLQCLPPEQEARQANMRMVSEQDVLLAIELAPDLGYSPSRLGELWANLLTEATVSLDPFEKRLGAAFTELAGAMPEQLAGWLSQLPQDLLQVGEIRYLMHSWVKVDPTKATAWIKALRPGSNRDAALSEWIWFQCQMGNLLEAVAGLRQIEQPWPRFFSYLTIMPSYWGGLPLVLRDDESLPQPQRDERSVARKDLTEILPQEIATVLLGSLDRLGEDRLMLFITYWWSSAPQAATAWAMDLPPGKHRDWSLSYLSSAEASAGHASTALSLAQKIADPAIKADRLSSLQQK